MPIIASIYPLQNVVSSTIADTDDEDIDACLANVRREEVTFTAVETYDLDLCGFARWFFEALDEPFTRTRLGTAY